MLVEKPRYRGRRSPARRALPLAVAVVSCVVLLAASRGHSGLRVHVPAADERHKTSLDPLTGCFDAQQPATPKERVLVTGAAGFIGYHTSKLLAEQQPDAFVLGLDNFTLLYNPALKAIRQARLSSCCNISIVQGDIRNLILLEQLFGCYHFTHVVHLAAHAGVRQSAAQPAQYASNNVEGTVVLLEAIRRQPRPVPSMVYASSSSVYGMPQLHSSSGRCCCQFGGCHSGVGSPDSAVSTQGPREGCWRWLQPQPHSWQSTGVVPGLTLDRRLTAASQQSRSSRLSSSAVRFDPNSGSTCLASLGISPSRECEAACAEPSSVYAATKLATESVVAAYVHQYGLAATGLRFFTVYGSLGRPDMAVTSFTRRLLAQEPISVLCFPLHPSHITPSSQQSSQPNPPTRRQPDAGLSEQHKQLPLRQQFPAPTAAGPSSGTPAGSLMVTKQALAAAMGGRAPPRSSIGTPVPPGCVPAFRDFTAVEDVAAGIQAALNSTAAAASAAGGARGSHRILNLGRGQPQSVLVLLQQLQQLLGVEARVRYKMAGAGIADVWVTWANMSAAEQQLGVSADVSLDRGLREFVAWYLSDADWVRQL